jgi:hypothetical protein
VGEQLAEVGGRAVDDDRPADVDVDRAPLGEERGHVGRGEPLQLVQQAFG